MSMSAATEQIMFDEMMRARKRGEYSPRESNYTRLFGTPERAARTLVDSCNDDYDYRCGGCPVARVNCKCGDYDALLGWLRGDAE